MTRSSWRARPSGARTVATPSAGWAWASACSSPTRASTICSRCARSSWIRPQAIRHPNLLRRAMAELPSRDRLQPSLLDRLTDDHPLQTHESIDVRVLSRQQLRAAILRDLTWLFNATRPQPEPASTRLKELAL